jgi:RNA polymerase-binding transcription factor DksA
MSDIAEMAERIEAQHRADAIERQRRASAGTATDMRYTHCTDCAAEIPAARRQAVRNCRRCIECEQAADLQARMVRRAGKQTLNR